MYYTKLHDALLPHSSDQLPCASTALCLSTTQGNTGESLCLSTFYTSHFMKTVSLSTTAGRHWQDCQVHKETS